MVMVRAAQVRLGAQRKAQVLNVGLLLPGPTEGRNVTMSCSFSVRPEVRNLTEKKHLPAHASPT